MSFWENLIRYPRFFLSSLLGLILVLFAPFFKFSKKTNKKEVLLLLFVGCLSFVYFILQKMLYSDF